MGIAVMIAGAILLLLLAVGLFSSPDDPSAEAREKALQAENTLKGRLLEAFQTGEPPTWQHLKALAQEAGVENERLPDVVRELSRAIASGEVNAPPLVLEAMQS